MRDTLIIGAGGAGVQVCRRLGERLSALPEGLRSSLPEILAVDTDRSSGQGMGAQAITLSATAAVMDAALRAPERYHAEWMDREVLRGRTTTEQGTGGARMVGRFLLLLPENRAQVQARIGEWMQDRAGKPCRAYVVASSGGGSGGGQISDWGYLLKCAAAAANAQLDVRAILFVPPPNAPATAPNSFAALSELHYYSDPSTVYRAHLDDGDAPFETRSPPFHRTAVLTSVTSQGEVIPLKELQERAAIYLLTASAGDDGSWEAERTERERDVRWQDPDGNPQLFTTLGAEWVEYPEERLVNGVYRNLVRRSLTSWLQGDQPAHLSELPREVPLNDSEAMASLMGDVDAGMETVLRGVRTRLPWIHKAPPSQWVVMDEELERHLVEATGTQPAAGRAGKGPMAERFKIIRDRLVGGLRAQSTTWLKKENLNLDRVTRVLNEAAADLRTTQDPSTAWEEALEATRQAKRRILWAASTARRDPFLMFWRRTVLSKLAGEYERIAAVHARNFLRAQSIPYLREMRTQVMEPLRAWAGRVGELGGLLARLSRSMADYEALLLEQLRRDDEEHRLALGLLTLPGAGTPYIANSSWNLPYARPEDEAATIRDLRLGWIQLLVDRPEGLLADPGRSVMDGPADQFREERLPWLMPLSSGFNLAVEGGGGRARQVVMRVDQELRSRVEDRLRTWLSATAFQRFAEQYRNPVELEFQLRRLVTLAGELPAIEPAAARPPGFPPEYELIFFGEAKTGEVPPVVQMIVDAASRERPTRVLSSRSTHYVVALGEHPGFPLSRCPAFHHLGDSYQELLRAKPGLFPFSRADMPWASATLVTRQRLLDAANVFFLALALGILQPAPDGQIPLPASVLALGDGERRFPLPGVFDLAVRQLAGDQKALDALATVVDRIVQSRGVEWSCLQVERAVHGESPLHVRFVAEPPEREERVIHLAAVRAACRHEDLATEYAKSSTGQETDWLRLGDVFVCPACRAPLGDDRAKLPGACPSCREVLLPHKVVGTGPADGFRRIPNPYVVGTPLETRAGVFVGREDIIQQVRDRLIRPAQRTILILIGERRCGKTSALKQLQYRLEGDLTPLFVDMQGLTATDLPGFLYWLAWRMKEALDERGIRVDLPTFEDFSTGPADYQFETIILPAIRKSLNGGRVLLMLDEFEVLAQRVMNGTFDSRAFDYIRHLMQHGEGIEFLFAGTHVLRQFAANYVTFLFNIGVFLEVDFLQPEDALRLIQEPVATAGVTFTPDALAGILELAGSHAYFTQLFCFQLIERLNRLRKRNVTREDVEGESAPVIAAAGAHLDHVWGQLASPERLLIAAFVQQCPRGQEVHEEVVLRALVQDDPGVRPFLFRSAVEKLLAVGLLRARQESSDAGLPGRMLRLSAEVYRQWILTAHPHSRLKEEGLTWE